MTQDLQKILVVEDDIDIQTIASLALETVGGFQTTIVSSGQEALDKTPSLMPQLILLDVMMPEMDGPTTLKKLRSFDDCKHIPVIFMTAKVQSHEVENYKQLGALDVISKPFDPMELANQIRTIWSQQNV